MDAITMGQPMPDHRAIDNFIRNQLLTDPGRDRITMTALTPTEIAREIAETAPVPVPAAPRTKVVLRRAMPASFTVTDHLTPEVVARMQELGYRG